MQICIFSLTELQDLTRAIFLVSLILITYRYRIASRYSCRKKYACRTHIRTPPHTPTQRIVPFYNRITFIGASSKFQFSLLYLTCSAQKLKGDISDSKSLHFMEIMFNYLLKQHKTDKADKFTIHRPIHVWYHARDCLRI